MMPTLSTSRPSPISWCAATLALAACSAGSSPEPFDDSWEPYDGSQQSSEPPAQEPSSDSSASPPAASPAQEVPSAQAPLAPASQPPPSPSASGSEAPSQAEPEAPTEGETTPPSTDTDGPPVETETAPPPSTLGGECCSNGDCLCHGPVPNALTDGDGPFGTDSDRVDTGTLFFPTDAEPPFAGLAIAAGFLNTGREILDWGEFFASYGIVTLVTETGGADFPDLRATKMERSIEEMKSMDAASGTPISGKMSGRYGTSGYSMGGGGTTITATNDNTLLSSVGLAPWSPVGRGIVTPTLLLCGSTDGTAPCSMSESAYRQIPETTPKMMVVLPGVGHLTWLRGPTAPDQGGALALAFMKTYLEGDDRWKSVLLSSGDRNVTTNITE